jgi:hypothetical protein
MWPQIWGLTKEKCGVNDATREPSVAWTESKVLLAVVKLAELSARQLERQQWFATIEKAEAGAFVDAEHIAQRRHRLAAGAKQASRDSEAKKENVKSAVADATFDLGPAGCWVVALGGPVNATKSVLQYFRPRCYRRLSSLRIYRRRGSRGVLSAKFVGRR